MCLATPVRIKSKIKNQKSKIMIEGKKEIDISLVQEAKVGDWLLVHGNLAVNIISAGEAKNIFSLIKTCSHEY